MSASTPRTCRRYGRRERKRGQRHGRPARARPGTAGCPSMSMRRWCWIIRQQAVGTASTWKKTFGYHPLLAFVDRPEIPVGEAVAGLLRNGITDCNTATDHVVVLVRAPGIASARWRPHPDPRRPEIRGMRSAATLRSHPRFAEACRLRRVGFSFGYPSMPGCRMPWTPQPRPMAGPGDRHRRRDS